MAKEKQKCLNCSLIRPLTEEEETRYPQNLGWCEGEGGTKTKDDILADRECSRFNEGENKIKIGKITPCPVMVRCLNCQLLDKLQYKLATPTHHQNWLCRKDGDTKQYEDCSALRCCNYFKPKLK